MRPITIVALTLVIIGGLNWLLVGAFNFDLVASIFGSMSPASRAVYVVVGLAAIYLLCIAPRLIQRSRAVRATVVS
jgi:uncharacterized protein